MLDALYPTLAAMESAGLPLLVHGEVTDPDIDIFDRENAFIERTLKPLCKKFPELKKQIACSATAGENSSPV